MTVAIPEAAGAVDAAAAPIARRIIPGRVESSRAVPVVGRRAGDPFRYATPRPESPRRRPRPASRQGTRFQPLPPPRGQDTAQRARPDLRRRIGQARRAAPTTRVHRGNYQPVILVEFVAAVLLTALSPVASKKNPSGLSPYAGQDMIKLGALTLVYLILALVSAGGAGAGRFAAWFGGLILLAVGLNEAASIAATLDLFGVGGTAGEGSAGPALPGAGEGSAGPVLPGAGG